MLKEIKISGSITSIGYEKSYIDLNHQVFSMSRNVIYFPCSYFKVKSKCSRFFVRTITGLFSRFFTAISVALLTSETFTISVVYLYGTGVRLFV